MRFEVSDIFSINLILDTILAFCLIRSITEIFRFLARLRSLILFISVDTGLLSLNILRFKNDVDLPKMACFNTEALVTPGQRYVFWERPLPYELVILFRNITFQDCPRMSRLCTLPNIFIVRLDLA